MIRKEYERFIWSDWDSDPAHAIWIGSEESKTNSENLNCLNEDLNCLNKKVRVDGIIETRTLDN